MVVSEFEDDSTYANGRLYSGAGAKPRRKNICHHCFIMCAGNAAACGKVARPRCSSSEETAPVPPGGMAVI